MNTCPEWVANFIYMCPEWVVYQETNEWYPMGDKYIPWGTPRHARRVYIYIYNARPLLCTGVYISIYLYIYAYIYLYITI